jgi:LemA protein
MVVAVAGLALGAVALVVGGGFGLQMWRRRWLIADLPTSDAAHVFVGVNEVVGRAVAVDLPVVAPYSAVECVWYRSLLEQEVRDERGQSSWKTVGDESSSAPFWVEDDTGRVLIRPEGASVYPDDRIRDDHAGRPGRHSSLSLLQTLAGAGTLGGLDGAGAARHRSTEWVIRPGDPIYVLGEASLRTDAVALEFAPCDEGSTRPRRSVLVAAGDEHRVARRTGWQAVALLLLAMAGAAAIPLAWEALDRARNGTPVGASPIEEAQGAMVVAALLVLAVLPVLLVGRLYNRLVSARNRVEAAWALIDVHLRRRHDLLPGLADVVAAATAHERTTHEQVARLRAGVELPPSTALPDASAISATATVDAADAERARSLVALAEAHPELRTSDNYQALARELALTEDGIAFARTFFNDAVTVLHDRRQQFPGLLMAPFVPVPALAAYRPGEPDRRPASDPQPASTEGST